MPVSIVKLGNSLRCPEKDCDDFGRIIKMKVSDEKVKLELVCDKHQKNYKRIYSLNQFVRMADSALIDEPWITNFQKHMMIVKGQFVKIRDGMEGAYYVKNKKLVQKFGPKIICDCGSFASVTFVKVRKDKTKVNLYCSECMPKGRKIKLPSNVIIELARAGIIDSTVANKVRDAYDDDTEMFDTSSAYSVGKGILANWVQEDLGMHDDGGGSKKCYICGTRVSDAMDRCPKCGSDL